MMVTKNANTSTVYTCIPTPITIKNMRFKPKLIIWQTIVPLRYYDFKAPKRNPADGLPATKIFFHCLLFDDSETRGLAKHPKIKTVRPGPFHYAFSSLEKCQ